MSDSAEPLRDNLALCHEIIRQQADTIRESSRRIEQLEHQVEVLLRRQYGPRRESVDPDQLRLFADEEADGLAEGDPGEPPEPRDAAPVRCRWRRRGRQHLPEHLLREWIEYELTAEELSCPDCGCVRVKIGEEISDQLEYVPASMRVLQHVRFRYACRGCQEHVAIAAKPPQTIDKGLHGPVLLAQSITSRYGDHLPLYRLEDIFARHGVELSRATLCGWMARCAELLTPLFNEMVKRVLLSLVNHTDDTTVPVWDPTLAHTRTGRFWVYTGDGRHPYVAYDYTPRRTRDGPRPSSRSIAATSRPTRSPATTGSAPVRARSRWRAGPMCAGSSMSRGRRRRCLRTRRWPASGSFTSSSMTPRICRPMTGALYARRARCRY
jgi:transposase